MLGKCCFAKKKRVDRKINRCGEWWWEGGRKKPLEEKPDESGGTKKNLDAILPTAPLGVEILN
jgi:hypothetical protein